VSGDDGGGLTIIPGPQGSDFAPQDFKSTDAIARIRHDLGASFIGGVFTDREIRGGGHNRVIGPDFQWRTEANTVTGEVLYSDNLDPRIYGGGNASSHAAYLGWNHLKRGYDWFIEGKDVGDSFRADLGFVPQNGYREIDGAFNLRFFPEHSKIFRFVRSGIFVDRQTDTDGNVLFRRIAPQILLLGAKNLTVQTGVRVKEQVRVGTSLLDETYGFLFAQIDPSRRFPRITFQGTAGESIDFANGRTGHGASLGLAATLRPVDKLTLDPNISREWLDAGGGRLYTASVERLKATYSFSAKSILRVIGQYVTTERNPSRYSFPVSQHSGSFLGSLLYSYKLNWQTVLFLGYGDDRVLTPSNDLVKQDRSFFFKVSYAIQR
jgi:hypothetical protein